jgi:hypothetical protein
MAMSAQLAKMTLSCSPSQRKPSVHLPVHLSVTGIRILSVNLVPTFALSSSCIQVSPGSRVVQHEGLV